LAGQTPATASVTHLNFGAPGSGDNVEAGVNNHYLNAKNHRNGFDGLLHKLLDLDQAWLHKNTSQQWTTEAYNTIRQTVAYSFRSYVNCRWGYSLQGIPFTVRARPGSQGTDNPQRGPYVSRPYGRLYSRGFDQLESGERPRGPAIVKIEKYLN
jgi:hypothetical protein